MEDPHWIAGQATLNESPALVCSVCGWAVAPSVEDDHEETCWKRVEDEREYQKHFNG